MGVTVKKVPVRKAKVKPPRKAEPTQADIDRFENLLKDRLNEVTVSRVKEIAAFDPAIRQRIINRLADQFADEYLSRFEDEDDLTDTIRESDGEIKEMLEKFTDLDDLIWDVAYDHSGKKGKADLFRMLNDEHQTQAVEEMLREEK